MRKCESRKKPLHPPGPVLSYHLATTANKSQTGTNKPNTTKHMSAIPTQAFQNSSLGAKVYIQVPAGLDNLVASATPEDVFFGAIKHTLHQKWNPAFRKQVVKLLVENTGVPVPSTGKVKKNRKGEEVEILISEAEYLKLVLNGSVSTGGQTYTLPEGATAVTEADFYVLAQQAADATPFTLAKAEEEAEPDARFFAMARQVLGMVEAGTIGRNGNPVTEDSFVSNWSANNPGHSFENLGGFTEEGIARALEIDEKRRTSQLPADLI